MKARANKFESLIALPLGALGLVFLGALLDSIYRLVLAGWRAAEFLFDLFKP